MIEIGCDVMVALAMVESESMEVAGRGPAVTDATRVESTSTGPRVPSSEDVQGKTPAAMTEDAEGNIRRQANGRVDFDTKYMYP